MLLAGCHAADAIRWFMREEVVEVSAFRKIVKGLYEYPANVVAVLKFAGGAIGKTSTLLDSDMPYAFNIDLIGTEGTLAIIACGPRSCSPARQAGQPFPPFSPNSGAVGDHSFDAEMNHLVDCIRTDQESHCNVGDAYHTHEISGDRPLPGRRRPPHPAAIHVTTPGVYSSPPCRSAYQQVPRAERDQELRVTLGLLMCSRGGQRRPSVDGIGQRGVDRLLYDASSPISRGNTVCSSMLLLEDGGILTGLVVRQDGDTMVLVDAQGKEILIPTHQIEVRRVRLSPMPTDVATKLSEQESYDLMAFLLEQREPAKAE